MAEPLAIAGAGRMGQALGRLLRERGESIAAVASRSADRAAQAAAFVGGGARAVSYVELPRVSRRILIAVPDDAIAQIAGTLAVAGMHGGVVLHTCGVRGPEVLAPLADAGAACGTLHPLQTVANPEEGVRVLAGSAFAVDGDASAVHWAEHLVRQLDGLVLRIPAGSRPLYHAAAVMASNYLIAMFGTAVMLMREAGVDEASARRALAPLALTSIENAARLGPAAALTGPISRGDADTVRSHLEALADVPAAANLYRAAGIATVALARQRGLARGQAAEIEEILRKAGPHG